MSVWGLRFESADFQLIKDLCEERHKIKDLNYEGFGIYTSCKRNKTVLAQDVRDNREQIVCYFSPKTKSITHHRKRKVGSWSCILSVVYVFLQDEKKFRNKLYRCPTFVTFIRASWSFNLFVFVVYTGPFPWSTVPRFLPSSLVM